MKKKLVTGLATGLCILGVSSTLQATPVSPENFNVGLNTGYSVSGNSSVDGNVDWLVFDSNGINPVEISFWFDRTVAAPDLIAGLYRGDTTGFDYAAAGADYLYSYNNAHGYNSALSYIGTWDDTHDDSLGGPWGDPNFSLSLSAGRYSLAVSSLAQGGTYQFTTNASSAYHGDPVPEPATMLLMGTGLAGLIGARRKKKGHEDGVGS